MRDLDVVPARSIRQLRAVVPRPAGATPIQEVTTMKRKDIAREAVRRSSVHAAAASVALENWTVPVGYVRTARVARLLVARKQTAR